MLMCRHSIDKFTLGNLLYALVVYTFSNQYQSMNTVMNFKTEILSLLGQLKLNKHDLHANFSVY